MKYKAKRYLCGLGWMLIWHALSYGQTEAGKFFPALDSLPINHLQVIGSHNSYKHQIDVPLFRLMAQQNEKMAQALDYSHIPILEQLDLGLANLEIDVYADGKGGKYAHPKGLDMEKGLAELAPYDPAHEMDEPGFKIFHVQELDFRSDYVTLKGCLAALRRWSDEHPTHLPIFITLEAKDQGLKMPGFQEPEKFTSETFDQLDQAIVEGLGRKKLIIPDDIRRASKTLMEGIKKWGWPTVKQARGKFVFILDAKGEKEALYVRNHQALKGRVLFANAEPGSSESGMMIRNNAKGELQEIQQWVREGYIIRTRADSDTWEARNEDYGSFKAAGESGAQIITTDYYKKSEHFPSSYEIHFDGGQFVRVNPLFR